MALLNVLKYPDPRLRKVAAVVDSIDDNVRAIVSDMFETMYEDNGVGLAATQVDIQQRILVADVSHTQKEPICLINPDIVKQEGYETFEEGCMSIPGVYEEIERAKVISVKALDKYGDHLEFEADGLLAVCIQHEIDHLNGKLFVDYLSPLKQKMIQKKMEKVRRRTL